MSTLVGVVSSLCCHMALVLAFMHLMVFLICDCFCPFFYTKNLIWYETPDQNGQYLLTLLPCFYESNTEGTNFRIVFVCFMLYIMCMFCESPEVTLCG